MTELFGSVSSPHVVLGIGLNVHTRREEFPPELQGTATSLATAGAPSIRRIDLLSSILRHLEAWYEPFKRGETRDMLQAWLKRFPLVGAQVRILSQQTEQTGKVLGLDEEGFLLLQDDTGQTIRILSGEIQGVVSPTIGRYLKSVTTSPWYG